MSGNGSLIETVLGALAGMAIVAVGLVVFAAVVTFLSDRSAVFVHEMRERKAEIDGTEGERSSLL